MKAHPEDDEGEGSIQQLLAVIDVVYSTLEVQRMLAVVVRLTDTKTSSMGQPDRVGM